MEAHPSKASLASSLKVSGMLISVRFLSSAKALLSMVSRPLLILTISKELQYANAIDPIFLQLEGISRLARALFSKADAPISWILLPKVTWENGQFKKASSPIVITFLGRVNELPVWASAKACSSIVVIESGQLFIAETSQLEKASFLIVVRLPGKERVFLALGKAMSSVRLLL